MGVQGSASRWTCGAVGIVALGAACQGCGGERLPSGADRESPQAPEPPAPPASGGFSSASPAKLILGGEYRIRTVGERLSAPNRANELRATWTTSGVWFQPRRTSSAAGIAAGSVAVLAKAVARG